MVVKGNLCPVSNLSKYLSSGQIWANILIASNGATTLDGKSQPLRTTADHKRFHLIRGRAKALAIGGNTFRNEPYEKRSLELYVSSQQLGEVDQENLHIRNQDSIELTKFALQRSGAPVLIEGGPAFLSALITTRLIDNFFVSRVEHLGNGDYFPENLLEENYRCADRESCDGTELQVWQPIS